MARMDPGTVPGDRLLDGPPPSPAFETGASTGQPGGGPGQPGPLGSLVPQIPAGGLPPEVLAGILASGEKIVQQLDSFAQVTPDLAPDWAAAKTALMNAMAKVLRAGAAPAPTGVTGSGFPAGGVDRGGMPAASGF